MSGTERPDPVDVRSFGGSGCREPAVDGLDAEALALVQRSTVIRGDQQEGPAAASLQALDDGPGDRPAETLAAALGVDEDRPDPADRTVGGRDARAEDPPVLVRDDRVDTTPRQRPTRGRPSDRSTRRAA